MLARDWARSGVIPLTGHPGEAPLVPPGNAATVARRIGERIAAATAGSAHPVRIDGAWLLSERAAYTGHRRRGRVSASGSCRLLPTADGWAAVSCARPDDPALLGALVGRELPGDVWPPVADWLRHHTGRELTERATLLGLAAGAVPAAQPAHPAHPRQPPWAADPPPSGSMAGRLVVDFSALWAGPLCAHLLGLAGARVVKVETPDRPDGARGGNPAFYDLLHKGHDGVVLDPRTPDGRRALADLVASADVVIEASRPRALARFGLDAAAAAAAGTIWVSITAYGRAADRIGFGDDVAAAAGLVARDAAGAPVFCGDAIADPITGLVAADLVLSAPAGTGGLFEVPMHDVVAATLAVAPTAGPAQSARRAGDRWVVDTDAGPVAVEEPRARP